MLHVFAPAPYGGLEAVVRSLAIEQAATGRPVDVAAVLDQDAPPHPVLSDLRDAGVEVYETRLPPRTYMRERRFVREVCRRAGSDILHTHGYRADVLHGGAGRALGVPAVTTVHGFTGGDWKNRIYEWLQRRAYRRYDAVVAVSHPLRAELEADGVPSDRLYCVPNAWVGDPTGFLDQRAAREELTLAVDRTLVGFVGRISPEKGADVFIDAMDHVTADVCGVMIGDGQLRPELEERVGTRMQTREVRFLGAVPDARRYLRAFDVLVLSSRTEGTPIVLLEAMAAGVPVVATRVGGIPDVVSGVEGVLVPPEEPVELAAAIDGVLADPAAAEARAGRARHRLAADRSAAEWVERYDEVYRMATNQSRGA